MVNTKVGPLGESTPEKLYALYFKNWALDTRKKTTTSLNDKPKPAHSGKPTKLVLLLRNWDDPVR
jgi:hypothetical protein